MPPLNVLITNCGVSGQSGTEMYVFDLARQLLRRGHRPVVYSPVLGPLADHLSTATISVVNDLASIDLRPDVIHGHHSLATLQALLHFPDTPAIYVCHDWNWVHDTPPKLPRIGRYIAVDETVRDRLVLHEGIRDSQVQVIYNGVDLDRFQPRAPLPPRPQRALAISNYLEPADVEVIRAACREQGMGFDTIGLHLGGVHARPEDILGHYDLVFAKGRCAWEALAVGAAVIVCDKQGLGPLVTTNRLASLRRANFGRRLLQQPLSTAKISQVITSYNAEDAAEVSREIRATSSLDDMVSQLLECYAIVIEEYRQAPAALAADMRAAAAFLRDWPARLASAEAASRKTLLQTDAEHLRRVIRDELKRERRSAGLRKWIQSIQKRWPLARTVRKAG